MADGRSTTLFVQRLTQWGPIVGWSGGTATIKIPIEFDGLWIRPILLKLSVNWVFYLRVQSCKPLLTRVIITHANNPIDFDVFSRTSRVSKSYSCKVGWAWSDPRVATSSDPFLSTRRH